MHGAAWAHIVGAHRNVRLEHLGAREGGVVRMLPSAGIWSAHDVRHWVAKPYDISVRVKHVVAEIDDPRDLPSAHGGEALP